MNVAHDHREDGHHRTHQDLTVFVVDSRVGKIGRTEKDSQPPSPFQAHHQAKHAEDHMQRAQKICRAVFVVAMQHQIVGLVPDHEFKERYKKEINY